MRKLPQKERMGCFAWVLLIWTLNALCLPVQAETLVTRWAREVSATNSLPEYPRPQLAREHWQNLNGLWDYQITTGASGPAKDFAGKILVPFPIESHLSGVGKTLDENSTLWYRRRFTVPPGWRGHSVLLHFGAVDWSAEVIINGRTLGIHRGGYDAFSFDLTKELLWDQENELLIAVMDPTEGDQPRGKQTRKVEGIFYTPSSGIWQTVWLEPVPSIHIQSLGLVPDLATPALRATVLANSLAEGLPVRVIVSFGGREVGRATGTAGTEIKIPLSERHPWSPVRPELYDVVVTLQRGNEQLDKVTSYFGLREVRVGTDAAGVRRLFLNGEPVFQRGVLDQGFWPDGLYTAPTDEALGFDLKTAKQLGFNLVRKHVKVEPERWYYWADKLGLLVWQDMPSGNNSSEPGRKQFLVELDRLLDQKANHPSIIMWVLFNEGWGQHDTERLARRIKAADPTRLVDSASGWTDLKVGDVVDFHSYPQPLAPPPEASRAGVLGEFGGLGLGVTNHTWSARQPWGYQILPNAGRLTDEYVKLWQRVWELQGSNGLAAAIYTQITDVETECNGFLTYDREVLKMDVRPVRRANLNLPKLVLDARDAKCSWNYTTVEPSPNWMQPNYDAAGWKSGIGGFGASNPPEAIINTEWKSSDIWLRREFELKPGARMPALLTMYHDEDTEVYLNGVLATSTTGFVVGYQDYAIASEARQALHSGRNVMAVHCHQTSGGQYIDVGLWSESETE